MHPAPITLAIQLPTVSDKPEWRLDGSIITLTDIPLTLLVTSLRDRIVEHLSGGGGSASGGGGGIPVSKMKLSFRGKLLTNQNSLASLNMDDDDLLVMTLRENKKK